MAKYVTYIPDSDLEVRALEAISATGGSLLLRGMSLTQIDRALADPEAYLISSRDLGWGGRQFLVTSEMNLDQLGHAIRPEGGDELIDFNPGKSRVIAFVGLSGGVGTTSIALNYAFELSTNESVGLIDLNEERPDIALLLGLRHIEGRIEKLSENLSVTQSLQVISDVSCKNYVFDLGTNISSPILAKSDDIYLVCRSSAMATFHLRRVELDGKILLNFSERSKIQQKWRGQLSKEFASRKFVNIPLDIKSFELALDSKSALSECAPTSIARKSIDSLLK